MKSPVWLSFDLGVQGDYESLYQWLDEHDAKECGDSLAFFSYEYEDSLLDELLEEIKSAVELTAKSRIYVIREVEGTYKGRFIYGKRKNAPWRGFAGFTQKGEDND